MLMNLSFMIEKLFPFINMFGAMKGFLRFERLMTNFTSTCFYLITICQSVCHLHSSFCVAGYKTIQRYLSFSYMSDESYNHQMEYKLESKGSKSALYPSQHLKKAAWEICGGVS